MDHDGLFVGARIDHMSIADNTWRFTMQCIGGQGVVVIALSLGLFGRAVDSSLSPSEGPQRARYSQHYANGSLHRAILDGDHRHWHDSDHGSVPLHRHGARARVLQRSLACRCFVQYGRLELDVDGHYLPAVGAPLEIVIMVLVLLGSINFTLHSEVWKGRYLEHFFPRY